MTMATNQLVINSMMVMPIPSQKRINPNKRFMVITVPFQYRSFTGRLSANRWHKETADGYNFSIWAEEKKFTDFRQRFDFSAILV